MRIMIWDVLGPLAPLGGGQKRFEFEKENVISDVYVKMISISGGCAA